MSRTEEAIAELKKLDEKVTRLGHIAALLEWDQETYLPPDAVEERASQIALIVGLHHEGIVDDELACAVHEAGLWRGCSPVRSGRNRFRLPPGNLEPLEQKDPGSQRTCGRSRQRNLNIPERLGRGPQSQMTSARLPRTLKRVIRLKREYAKAVSPDGNAYDVLLDDYEPGAKGAEIAVVFDGLADGLNVLMKKIRSGSVPDTAFLEKSYSIDLQNDFGRKIQSYMGYDYRRGRLDLSTHPFTTTLGPDDVRVTTRYDRNQVLSGLFEQIHEAGHGLYEQGIGRNLKGTMLADGTSLGIHESQSRFWENTIGRSRRLSGIYGTPSSRGMFPENLEGVSAHDFYRAVNLVKMSLIRVEADEVTYSFHIIIRFRLEKALISGELPVKDLPEAWRSAYREHLGIIPPSDALGCMQDVSHSVGLFGYFPTYALGNLYAAQFTRTMENQLGPVAQLIGDGHTDKILNWLRQNIHRYGRVFPPGELCPQSYR